MSGRTRWEQRLGAIWHCPKCDASVCLCARLRAEAAEARADDLARALESICCHAAEGPDVYALEGRPLIHLMEVIAREASAALARYRDGAPTGEAQGGSER